MSFIDLNLATIGTWKPGDKGATLTTFGKVHQSGQYAVGNINKDPNNFWHSLAGEKERGFEVEFESDVNIYNLRIGTRKDCCSDRYKNLVLKADGKMIARTTENFMPHQE